MTPLQIHKFLMILLILLFQKAYHVQARGAEVECLSKEQYNEQIETKTVKCRRRDHPNEPNRFTWQEDKKECQNSLDSLVNSTNKKLEDMILKALEDENSRKGGTPRQYYSNWYGGYDHTFPQDVYACATVAINVKLLLTPEKEERFFLEIRGIYWGDYKGKGDKIDPNTGNSYNVAKTELVEPCKKPHKYKVWDSNSNEIVGIGEIFYCPCFDKDNCNSDEKVQIPHLDPGQPTRALSKWKKGGKEGKNGASFISSMHSFILILLQLLVSFTIYL